MSEVDASTKPVEAPSVEAPPVEAPPVEQQQETSADAAAAAAAEDDSMIKTTAQTDYKDVKKNNKFDPSVREVTDDPEAIRKQVEFYFGDWNFPQDKFMWETCGGSENKPMPITKIHSFKRMRTFQPYSAVVAALRDSKFLEVSGEEGAEVVKRKTPYKPMPEGKAKAEAATVYVKGFGDECPDTQFDLESFFAQFGEVKGLKLRRTNENLFKGSVFVTFMDEDAAKKFLATEPKPTWKGHELKMMTKKAYCDEKSDLIRQGKIEPSSSGPRKFYEGKDNKGRPAKKGSREQDDWKKRRDHDQKNGFRDGRGGRGRGGRGGRGRGGFGRGGRDGGRRDKEQVKDATYSESAPEKKDEKESNGKRAREEDAAGGEEPAAKKVDTKETTEA
ncbi:LA motif RNA-binding domain protein [Metarhizium robertsii]|uniref:RNA-binding protein Lupus La n=2 Tax=Metarhizium robertsii TaxID=568076 RepID=E9EMM6_METRA|nr:RNA-binding protein Lupus La [Metarhizium robertsii ARSEF 23]EFZ04045.1 RNA-binding protein Lupus La [Metarhizium robertsii ARSEF 23]EXV00989.1 LA motif RNA-binding domain protein [Metarhizium robertsii]